MLETLEKPEASPDLNKKLPTMDCHQIMRSIPHRYPFLLVDGVTGYDVEGWTITGYKNVSFNDPFFQGHFPDNPIMPGVLIVESMAQLGAILLSQIPQGQNKLGLFAGIDDFRFRHPVVPGDRLELFAHLLKIKGMLGKAYGKATVNGQLVAEGHLLFSMVPADRKFENL